MLLIFFLVALMMHEYQLLRSSEEDVDSTSLKTRTREGVGQPLELDVFGYCDSSGHADFLLQEFVRFLDFCEARLIFQQEDNLANTWKTALSELLYVVTHPQMWQEWLQVGNKETYLKMPLEVGGDPARQHQVQKFTQSSANINFSTPSQGQARLQANLQKARLRIVKSLLRKGADPNQLFYHDTLKVWLRPL